MPRFVDRGEPDYLRSLFGGFAGVPYDLLDDVAAKAYVLGLLYQLRDGAGFYADIARRAGLVAEAIVLDALAEAMPYGLEFQPEADELQVIIDDVIALGVTPRPAESDRAAELRLALAGPPRPADLGGRLTELRISVDAARHY